MNGKAPNARTIGTDGETPRGRVSPRQGEGALLAPNYSGPLLMHARNMRGLSRMEAARALGIGLGTIAKYEQRGITDRTSKRAIDAMCETYGIEKAELLATARHRTDIPEGGIYGVGR